MTRHAVVVLAAGGSTRLGQPKQLLKQHGETLVHRTVRLAASTHPEKLVVVVGAHADVVSSELSDLQCDILHNSHWCSGMASSLQSAARVVSAYSRVLILACDQPALEQEHLHTLLAGVDGDISCAATRINGIRSIPAVVPGAWFTEMAELRDDQGFRQRLRSLSDDQIFLLSAPALALDIDTPADRKQACSAGMLDP